MGSGAGDTLELKEEVAWLGESGQSQTAAARGPGVVDQTLASWVRARGSWQLEGSQQQAVGDSRARWRTAACVRSWRV